MSESTIVLVIGGGIAAYRALDVLREFRRRGVCVRPVLTDGGARFVTRLSVQALAGRSVATDLFDDVNDADGMAHIHLSRGAHAVLVVPCSANMMARLACGMADDLATALILAADCPVIIAPSMNPSMWRNRATEENLATLCERKIQIITPQEGETACGEDGIGRLAPVDEIVKTVIDRLRGQNDLGGRCVLVTSGPTIAPVDRVRHLVNRSSGRQGHAIAKAFARRGVDVHLVTGPTALPDPYGMTIHRVDTTDAMARVCDAVVQEQRLDAAVFAAAPLDWTTVSPQKGKLTKKEHGGSLKLMLRQTPDVMMAVTQGTSRPSIVVGFALEMNDAGAVDRARQKAILKRADWMVLNTLESQGARTEEVLDPFDSQINTVSIVSPDESMAPEVWPMASKDEIAQWLVERVAQQWCQHDPQCDTTRDRGTA